MKDSYIQKLRRKIGSDHFICPGARIIMEDAAGKFLFLIKNPNNKWGIPAGGIEENESIFECIQREVKEETNLNLHSAILIGISSQPARETCYYSNGDVIQYFTSVFYSKDWSGEALPDDDEVAEVRMGGQDCIDRLPPNERSAFDFLARWQKSGQVIVD